ncbi:MAG: hypothetical protein BWK77_07055 [Verrucomicrobia bacterium A1]|nr:MAG: hypothetical protein BWK77_07055 [Verrucomicrobia bacterium A1]
MVSLRQPALRATGLGLALLAAGCATENPNLVRPLKQSELRSFFSRAKDPRRFWITVYVSEQGPVFAGANRVHRAQVVKLPFQPEQTPILLFQTAAEASMPVVKFDLGRDEAFLALLDTTSTRNWLDFGLAQKFDVLPIGPPAISDTPMHVQDAIPGYASVAGKLRFNQLNVESAVLYTRAAHGPLGPLARRKEKPWPQLVVGTDLLKAFQFVQLDYPNRRAVFSATAGYAPEPDALIATVTLHDIQGTFAAQGTINGQARTFILDSAGDFEVAMPSPPTNHVLRQVTVGDLVFRQVTAVSSASQGLGLQKYPRIGRRLLCRFRVTIAPGQRKVFFEKPGPK